MIGTFVSGNWTVNDGDEDAFAAAWSRFLDWTDTECTGLRWAVLLRDGDDRRHVLSLANWDTPAERDAWRSHPDFPAYLGACRALCEEFRAADYELVALIRADRLSSS
jgi:heme-degrading monooxygenase HmoA